PRDGLAAVAGLPRVHVPRPRADRLGLRPLAPTRAAPPQVLPVDRPACRPPGRRAVPADRLPLAVHLLARRRQPLRATRLPPPRAVPGDVTSPGWVMTGRAPISRAPAPGRPGRGWSMICRCAELTELRGPEADRYADEHLRRVGSSPDGWEVT